MTKSLMLLVLGAVVCSPFVASDVSAATVMKMKQEYFSEKAPPACDVVVAIEGKLSRADSGCGPRKVTVLMNGEKKALTMVDYDQKRYFVMDQKTMEQLQKNPMAALEKDPKYAAQMAKMSPEQKAMMKKMMAGMNKQMGETRAELKKLDKSKKVKSWSCNSYGIFTAGKLAEELCVADKSQFPTLIPVMETWKGFMKDYLKMNRSPTLKAHEELNKIGIAVETLIYTGGNVHSKMEMQEVKDESFPASHFQVPAGFTEAKSPLMN